MNKRLILSISCLILATVLCVLSFAGNESEINTEAEQHYEKAYELRKVTDYDAAISEYEKVISLSPNSKIAQNAQYWIGQSYFESKQFDTALSAFQSLFDKYPTSSIAPTTETMIERVQQAKKNRALFEAVNKGDTEQVKSLIAEGADIDAKWSDFYNENEGDPKLLTRQGLRDSTPLWHAVNSHNFEMVKLLVEQDPNMNAGRWPPLGLAVDRGGRADTTIVEYLIDHGANVNYPESWGPLQEAATFSIEKVKLLVSRGANVNGGLFQPTIHAGIRSWSTEIVEFLIQHGADVNAKDEWGRGYTPLQRAALTGQTEMVKLLLAAGADINARDDNGQTALHLPLDMRNSNFKGYWLSKDTIELLLIEGADVNSKDKNGRTPWYLAAELADGDIVKLLIDHGADVNTRDDATGFTALHYAAGLGNMNAAEVLIANGADINAKDKEGHTPLYIAINHDYKIAEFLIDKGADSSIKTETGKTLLQLAQERKQVEATVPDLIFEGEPNGLFGAGIVCGDIDGDGYDDILIREPRYDNDRGRVDLFYGGSNVNNKAGLIFEGQNEGEMFGYDIACGDIDNDGYDDIIVVASRGEFPGRAYLFWGSDRDSMDVNPDKIFDEQVKKNSLVSNPYVYDIDNDGYGDIILGTYLSESPSGKVYLYYGNKKELMDTAADLIFTGEKTGERFGYSISCGDVDNDGYGDIVIGTIPVVEAADKGVWDKSLKDSSAIAQSPKGRTYLYYGNSKSNMDAKADIIFEVKSKVHILANRDGYDNVIVGANGYNDNQGRVYLFHGNSKNKMDANPDIILDGEVARSDYGIKIVSGDIDGDGVKDLIIGACGFKQLTGRVYLYWGKDLAGPDPKPGKIFTGEQPYGLFGFGLACGDINKDGYDDLVVGAYNYKSGAGQGRVYLYYGGARNK